MRKITSRIFTTIGLCLLILGLIFSAFPSQGYAEDLELIGKDIGLAIEPANERLFDLRNLNPGDTKSAKLTIKNNYSDPFNLYMRAERMGELPTEGEADLFNILVITVTLRGEKIYEGPIKGFATSNISLGKFNSGSREDLVATVHLPGAETGNEYQGKAVDVKWIFIAESISPPPEEPDDPDKPDKPEKPDKPDKPIEEPEEEIPDAGEPEEPGKPEEPEEPIEESEENIPDIGDEEEPKEEPEDKPVLPKTGELPLELFYVTGSLMVLAGVFINPKNKK